MGDEEKEWMLSNLVENEKDEEEEEALSLCDLPNNKEEKQSKKESPRSCTESQEEFDFWWWGGSNSLKESQMCAADDVFFQGQILPLRHSISSDGGSLAGKNAGRCHSLRYNTSSRSSSVKSHLSSCSASSSASTTTTINSNNKKQSIRKQSTPQVRFSKVVSHNSHTRNSSNTLWTLFRAGLVSTPEIDFHDLKIRQHNNNNNRVSVKRNKNLIFFSSCSCSVNDVQTMPPRMARKDKKGGEAATKVMTKQATSRLRTFEWLKHLSLEGSAATTL